MAWQELVSAVQDARCDQWWASRDCGGPDRCEECQRWIARHVAETLGVTLDGNGDPYDPDPSI